MKDNTSPWEKQPESNCGSLDFLRTMVANRPGGENRPQQEHAVREIEDALQNYRHLLIQAGTGTGKSYATLIPAILSGERIVYSTATKQLSEQIIDKDIPVLRAEVNRQGGTPFSAVLLKGRENYLCKKKLSELQNTGDAKPDENTPSLFGEDEVEVVKETPMPKKKRKGDKRDFKEMAKEYDAIYKWADKTRSGDRSEGPAVSDEVWRGVSVTNNECPGRSSCPFGEICFAEKARDEARSAQIVVTNHAITALDLENAESSLLGERKVFIFDEIHEIDSYLSTAWGTTISEKILSDALQTAKKFKPSPISQKSWDTTTISLTSVLDKLSQSIDDVDSGLFSENELPSGLEEILREILSGFQRLGIIVADSVDDSLKKQLIKVFGSVKESLLLFLDDSEENVRWAKNEAMEDNTFFKKDKTPAPPSLHCAPMRIGPRLMSALNSKDATMIGTSATITVGGKFDSPIHDLALNEPLEDTGTHREFKAIDVGTPFNFAQQAMICVPDHNTFPSADFKSRAEHSAAVEESSLKLVAAAGGRSLVLTTTTRRVGEIGEYLEDNLPSGINVLKQGDMPAPQLIEEFIKDETSVLVATMGMWHGLNAEGPTCMLVIMDKIPFPPMNDPLATARQNYANENGRNGFMDVYVASANVKIAQGFGRLIRTMSDRGVVVIFDTRMHTKSYGRSMLKSLPHGLRMFKDLDVVAGSLERLRQAREAELEKA